MAGWPACLSLGPAMAGLLLGVCGLLYWWTVVLFHWFLHAKAATALARFSQHLEKYKLHCHLEQ